MKRKTNRHKQQPKNLIFVRNQKKIESEKKRHMRKSDNYDEKFCEADKTSIHLAEKIDFRSIVTKHLLQREFNTEKRRSEEM